MAEIWLGVLEGAQGTKKPIVMKRAIATEHCTLEVAQAALITESKIGALLSHPNIVHSYALVEVGAEMALAMEYLPGLSIRTILEALGERKILIPSPAAYRIIADVARGLEHAHAASPDAVVHGDISPENLIVTEQGITKIVDFGVAQREEDRARPHLSKAPYAAPERRGCGAIEPASDVFALGAVIHELFTGRMLFGRETLAEALEAVLRAPIPELDGTIPFVIRDTVRRMLVRDPALRQIAISEVADAFDRAAADAGAGHRDVAIFLRSEFAPTLHARRQTLSEILGAPAPPARTARLATSSTSTAVDALFEAARAFPTDDGRRIPLGDPEEAATTRVRRRH
jgi:serine/threonine-protein kinase